MMSHHWYLLLFRLVVYQVCVILQRDIVSIYQRSQPVAVFCDIDFYDLVNESLKEVGINAQIFTLNGAKGDSETVENLFEKIGTEDSFIPIQADGVNDAAIKMCSSGTTSPSKGRTYLKLLFHHQTSTDRRRQGAFCSFERIQFLFDKWVCSECLWIV
ncbi:uncharacterized protein LOC116347793 [Contarinia nasturtii]|uniref:uncharacterized protein LOC116347793 n=1 Tax=Contarinia nasturtii TaxID=265458 RepID=UPI0012D459B8|nr:uncharacterized protein LOC116347793 [Contarinia nasturtii]